MEQSTIDTVCMYYEKHGSYRKTAAALGIPYTLVRDILKGKAAHVSLATENHVRALLGLTALLPSVTVPSCPDCGGVHHGRCNGKTVEVRAVRHRRPPERIADYTATQLASAIRNRHPMLDAAT